jgi:uncharacterized phage protein (TIGR01671 family)
MRDLKFRVFTTLCTAPHMAEIVLKHSLGEDLVSCEGWTVMQAIGKRDKNGVDIYEGDIVQDVHGWLYKVSWKKDHSAYVMYSVDRAIFRDMPFTIEYDGNNLEVVGNIYQNKELILI